MLRLELWILESELTWDLRLGPPNAIRRVWQADHPMICGQLVPIVSCRSHVAPRIPHCLPDINFSLDPICLRRQSRRGCGRPAAAGTGSGAVAPRAGIGFVSHNSHGLQRRRRSTCHLVQGKLASFRTAGRPTRPPRSDQNAIVQNEANFTKSGPCPEADCAKRTQFRELGGLGMTKSPDRAKGSTSLHCISVIFAAPLHRRTGRRCIARCKTPEDACVLQRNRKSEHIHRL